MYIYPQSYTEKILEEEVNKKGIFVKKEVELISIKNIGNNVIVNFKNDEKNHIYDYVIGADGARSIIRKELGFEFIGETIEQMMYVEDYENEGEPLMYFKTVIGNPKILGLIPVKGKIIRIISNTPDYDELIPLSVKIDKKKCLWKSNFKINNRHVNKLSKGRVFLMGDAAHVHIPAGGRGLNLGIADAFIFSHLLREGKLHKYNDLRYPIISEFISKLKKLSKLFILEKSILRGALHLLAPFLGKILKD